MIRIYFSNFRNQLSDEDFFKYLDLLPLKIKEKILCKKKWEDRQASLFSKLLLKKGLEDLGKESTLYNLNYTEYGRPYVGDNLDFNISHSNRFTICAFSTETKIGIDIEEIKPLSIFDFKDQFSNEEWKSIVNAENRYYQFYYYWTAKEAAIKADGKGLSIPLNTIEMKNNKIRFEQSVWFIKNIVLFDNCIIQLASSKEIKNDIELCEISFENKD